MILRKAIRVVLLGGVLSSACVLPANDEPSESSTEAATSNVLKLPIYGDFPDPTVVSDGSRVHVYATNGNGRNIPHLVASSSMADWRLAAQDALPRVGPWAEARFGCTWAPGVYRAGNGSWVMFYSAQRKGRGNPNGGCGWMCIGRAVASSPDGPFVDNGGEALCDTGSNIGAWSLDPSPFVDDDGRAYVYWRQDTNGNNGGNVAVQALDDAGRPVGGRNIILSRDRAWELPVMENPRMARINGRYILFYSANDWEKSTYGVGYATCSGPMGPCAKQTNDAPWLSSLFSVHGIGGEDVFVGPNQVRYLAVHGYEEPKSDLASGGQRKLWFYELHLDGSGRPALAAPPAPMPTGAVPAPSACGVMRKGQGLGSGRTLASCNGRYALTMQSDGNLVLYRNGGGALWSSGTSSSDGFAFLMQADGNAVLLGRYKNRSGPRARSATPARSFGCKTTEMSSSTQATRRSGRPTRRGGSRAPVAAVLLVIVSHHRSWRRVLAPLVVACSLVGGTSCSVLTSFDGFTGHEGGTTPTEGGVEGGVDASPDVANAQVEGGGETGSDAELPINGCTTNVYADKTDAVLDVVIEGPPDVAPVQYNPPCVKIARGKTVQFKSSAIAHDTYFQEHPLEPFGGDVPNPIPAVSDGGSKSVTFDVPGRYGFRCKEHPTQMAGAIWVVP